MARDYQCEFQRLELELKSTANLGLVKTAILQKNGCMTAGSD